MFQRVSEAFPRVPGNPTILVVYRGFSGVTRRSLGPSGSLRGVSGVPGDFRGPQGSFKGPVGLHGVAGILGTFQGVSGVFQGCFRIIFQGCIVRSQGVSEGRMGLK